MDKNTIYSDVSLLHPEFATRITALSKDLIRAYEAGSAEFRFEIFETYRSPIRQAHLKATKRSKAGAFEGAHVLGLAADFVPFLTAEEARAIGAERPGWNWDNIPLSAWEFLKKSAELHALVLPVFSWDKPHVESPLFPEIRKMLKRA